MKRILALFISLLSLASAQAEDGIQFSHGSWKEILSQAKKENKLIFIDVYTSWCGPCKMMAAEIFPQKVVADKFNASFINYKIDAEKGEGVQIAKQFEVHAFPTYLFVNGNGDLIYRTSGYMPAASFLDQANIALKAKDDPKPIAKWQDEYNNGKRSKDFLLAYMKKRSNLKLPSAEIIEELFPLLTKEDLKKKDVITSLIYFDANIQFVPGGKLFTYVLNNYKQLDSSKIIQSPLGIMEFGIRNYFKKNIVENKKEKMLPVMIQSYKKIMQATNVQPAEIIAMEKELPVEYYGTTGDATKLAPAVIDYVQNGIMKLDIAGKQKQDEETFAGFMAPYLTGKADSTKDEKFAMKRIMQSNNMVSISYQLRDAAEEVYKNISDPKLLKQATDWAKQADEWFPHFSSKAVYAGLLFKIGNTQQAVHIMESAGNDPLLEKASGAQNLILANVEKMKNGEAPKSLWK
ncbi:MAG: thioredoxin family protein [Chitinophaga sp.]|uniref:thioredoxin family protein n=1 Tax=Chitinophaga sp. TaxID=1869181 RepID=UPI0025B90A3A|nr:thioredoxin family protein [Chitinophaga sp.]MBV8251520.1 thioredoxin family protein [Chitinophaga sp.]